MPDLSFDVLVIGAGPGGYVAAIRSAQLGFKTACIDKETRFGGTCLRIGCIPSKALLDASEKLYLAQHHFAGMGIKIEKASVDLPTMMARKDRVVETLTSGVSFLMKKNKIEKVVGAAKFVSANTVEVTAADGKKQTITAKHIIIATGSAPVELPFMKYDGKRIINSDHGIALDKVPASMVVIGGGAIGLELGSVWMRLGAKVTVLEMLPTLVAGSDEEMARGLEKVLKKQGMNFYMQAKVTGAAPRAGSEQLDVAFEWEGKKMTEPADVVLVAVGRKPYTDNLGLDAVGVKRDNRGRIETDKHYHTSVPGIYAIGDVIAGPMLAHKAEDEGVACMELIAGKAGHVNYGVIPGVVYTAPELAWVGRTEEQCKAENIPFNTGKFQFRVNGRALAMDETEGFVKVIAHAQTDRVLGVHILGPQGSSMIAEAAAVMEFAGTAEDLGRTCHAHPTLPEAVKEAALGALKRAIHA
ncbi:MAG TPA: dihydrolipoyl dehydrogenase [Phycisphaerae bacterium]|nr:dihydrolipoyl dehydrogenase [Phycisphaerae bacterium]